MAKEMGWIYRGTVLDTGRKIFVWREIKPRVLTEPPSIDEVPPAGLGETPLLTQEQVDDRRMQQSEETGLWRSQPSGDKD